MTAEIGVLNKSAVALAADSAVTVSGVELEEGKVYNTANKIFNLIRNEPVGIMIYNSSQICSVPWETLIKLYRESLKGKSFDTIIQYKNSFIQFLHRNKKYFTLKAQANDIQILCYNAFDIISDEAYKIIRKNLSDKTWENFSGKERNKVLTKAIIKAINIHFEKTSSINKLKTFKTTLEEVKISYDKEIDKWTKEFARTLQLRLFKKDKDLLKNLIYNFITNEVFIENWSGVVIVGFGVKQIFPQLVDVTFGAVICNNFRYKVNNEKEITNESNALISPFAQRDMIDTFVQGIDPDLNEALPIILKKTFEQFSEHIAMNMFEPEDQESNKNRLLEISDKVVDYFNEEFKKLRREEHINPILDAVSSLSKEDLAEMAESLINLTYLKRRISLEEKEESVGGPIDVAIITKGDGFIWLKRKHYFQVEKNIQYIAKLLKNS